MKRYTVNYLLRNRYGEKIYKLALKGGVTCPNRDGSISSGGCIFCSAGGSGDFASASVDDAIAALSGKSAGNRYIAYFQDYSVTYNTVENLEKLFAGVLARDDIVIISVATRPDCLGPEILEFLGETNRIKPVWVELGLQTSNEKTAGIINRGYNNSVFENAVRDLRDRGIDIIVHLILGLPGEDETDIINSVKYISRFDIQGVKFHLMHVLKGTVLEKMYRDGEITLMNEEEYADLVCSCMKALREDIVIHRFTGDGPKSILVAPEWSADKKHVLNLLRKRICESGIDLL